MNTLQMHEEAIRSLICADCIYPSGSGICGEGHTADCPLNTLLPRAVEAVKKRQSSSIVDYLQSLQTNDKSRDSRLDRVITAEEARWLEQLLPTIVAAVQEAEMRMERLAVRPGR